MRLSSLKVAGFKSFADSTTFNFKENRTAIVGPNGCGKSNVIDAIRWVMGESSAKQLRGGNMQDVIFAGTSQRKPVGVASVELRFDNTYGKLGGAYNAYNELSVKRQVNREGKSDYFLNGTRCRRKDITDIFLGTGLGPRSYAVIEQGMINRLVDAKPEEMRVFLEEAAGISRYQARRKETLQHLEHTQSNVSRLNDVYLELQAQIKSLKRQAEQAEKYQALQQQIKNYKVQLLSMQYQHAAQQTTVLSKQLAELTTEYQSEQKALEHIEVENHILQQKIQQQMPQAEQLQQSWQQAQQQHQQIVWQVQQDEQQQQQLNHNLLEHTQQQQQLQDDFSRIQQDIQQLAQELTKNQKELHQTEQINKDSQLDLATLQSKFEQEAHSYQQQQKQLDSALGQQQQLNYQLSQVSKTTARTEQVLQQLFSQQKQNLQQDTQLQLDDLNIEIVQVQLALEALTAEELQFKQQLQYTDEQKNKFQKQYNEAEHQQKQLQREIIQTEKLLDNIRQTQDEVATSPLLEQLQLTYQGQQYSHWIEKILAKWLLAETGDEFSDDYMGARQLKICSLSSVNSTYMAKVELPHIETWISFPQHPLWQHIYIAQNQQEAQRHLEYLTEYESIVTEDGFWLAQTWWVNLQLDDANSATGQLHYLHHLQSLKHELQAVDIQVEPLFKQWQDAKNECEMHQTQIDMVQQTFKQKQKEHHHLTTEQAKLTAIFQSNEQKIQQLTQQIEQQQLQLSEDKDTQAQIQYDLVGLQLKIEQMQPQVAAQKEQFERSQQQLKQLNMQTQQDVQNLQQLQQQIQQLESKQALLKQDEKFREERLAFISEQLLEYQQQLAKIVTRIEISQQQVRQTQEKEQLEHQKWLAWQQQVENLQQQQQHLSEQRVKQQQQEHDLRDALEQIRLNWQQFKVEQSHVMEQLQQLGYSHALTEQYDVTQIQAALEKAEQQFAKIGAINLAAVEELQGLQTRYDELAHQIEDLQQTVVQLQDAMKSIDQETKQLFMKTFTQVNHELQDLFPKIFTGGEASLTLEEGWQSGVKLMARPPGKRNSSLALLSGGEKALTALALVFAIFRLNPAPFCVLDEVDAPLDDANVNRFCNLVKELSQQVQFIYITHNKLAMTMATDLLGVTMPDAGSSKLVAVSLAQAEAYGMTTE